MQSLGLLPEPIIAVHSSLESFVKQRQDVTQIRRVLTLHLSTHINPEDGFISKPLSLLQSGSSAESSSSGIRGIRREYLRCVRANSKAREEYQKIKRECQRTGSSQQLESGMHSKYHDNSGIPFSLFLDAVKYRRKHERLRILQDYADMLAKKSAAAADHLDPQVVMQDVESLPSVPSDVIIGTKSRQESQRTDLNELVEQLEKSVLRTNVQLRREQTLLAKLRREESRNNLSNRSGSESKLAALGLARNELIVWIEAELARAGENPDDSENVQSPQSTEKEGKNYINGQLSSIRRQYAQYIKVRQELIFAATGTLDVPPPTLTDDDPAAPGMKDEVEISSSMSHILQPYLEDLTSVSSQQKSMIQQKSHLTISLAKQLKEAGQGLDRLADESHLLPAYPLGGSSQQKGSKSSLFFGDEISSHEKPDSSHRARAWVHASEAASKATNEAVAVKLDEGELAISDTRQKLLELRCLLGEDVESGIDDKNLFNDIWATLAGDLGITTKDGMDV